MPNADATYGRISAIQYRRAQLAYRAEVGNHKHSHGNQKLHRDDHEQQCPPGKRHTNKGMTGPGST